MMPRPSKPYYRYFKNIKIDTITLVRHWIGGVMTIVEEGLLRTRKFGNSVWEISEDGGFDRLRVLLGALNNVYNLPLITLAKGTREVYYHGGHIELPKVSAISFLHEYRHHMQKYNKQHYRDVEDDARGWSISLFAQAFPDKFDKAWQNGRIWYLPQYSPNWRQEVGL